MKRESSRPTPSAPSWGFDLQYELPADYLALDMIGPDFVGLDMSDYRNSDASDYAIEGRKILTNRSAPLLIRYKRQVTEPGLFDPCFVKLLAIELAYVRASASPAPVRSARACASRSAKRSWRACVPTPSSARRRPFADDTWMIGRL
jgi:hypothetical protein